MKKILLPIIVLTSCIAFMWKWTSGFKAFTVFSYTLKEAGKLPREFPDFSFINQDSVEFNLKNQQHFTLVNFVYLNCPNVCHKINNQLEELYHSELSSLIPNQLEFVTVSFDLDNDNLRRISTYRNYFGDDLSGWNFALPINNEQQNFNDFLQKMGVWAEPVPGKKIINHSTYIFLVSPDHKIVTTIDPIITSNEEIANIVRSWVNGGKIASL
ncbi:MAG: SCO family protein [Brumimicrobium sp.]|nr:SCO family protein [Brumimicrobium sp.]